MTDADHDASRWHFPVLGDLSTIDLSRPLDSVTDRLRRLGAGMIELPTGEQPVIFLADTELIREVNNDNHWGKHVGPSLRRLRSILGDGLFTAFNGEANWRTAHNILMPSFTGTAMKTYHATMAATVAELIEDWSAKATAQQWIDIPASTNRLTMEIIARIGMGHTFGRLTDAYAIPFVGALQRELAYADRNVEVTQTRRDQHNSDKAAIRRHVAELIGARRRTPTADSNADLLDTILYGSDPDTGRRLDGDNAVDQVLTLLVAGSETSANALAFALHCLSTHPDIAERARDEIDERGFADGRNHLDAADVEGLTYLRCVVEETLRLWPVAPGYYRQARHDTVIGEGHEFRAGEWVFVHLIAAHRDQAWGPYPDEFNPDRFLPENLHRLAPRTYKPFGVGARACLGRRFAMHEMLLCLASVLRHFELEPRPGYHLAHSEEMTLKPVDLHVLLHRRS